MTTEARCECSRREFAAILTPLLAQMARDSRYEHSHQEFVAIAGAISVRQLVRRRIIDGWETRKALTSGVCRHGSIADGNPRRQAWSDRAYVTPASTAARMFTRSPSLPPRPLLRPRLAAKAFTWAIHPQAHRPVVVPSRGRTSQSNLGRYPRWGLQDYTYGGISSCGNR